nr:hypothetical protein [Tanacetum cinerariifolium]
MANVPPNNPNVDAPAIVPAPVNPDHAPAQPVGLGNGFAPHWIRDNIPNNQNGWIEEDAKEEEKIRKKIRMRSRKMMMMTSKWMMRRKTVRNVMSDLSRLKKLVKGLSDRFDKYEMSKVFDAKRVLEKELVNERNVKELYREFDKYMCRMLQNHQKSEGSFPLPLSSDAADAAIATSDIDDDDDTAPMDSQPHEPRGSPRDTHEVGESQLTGPELVRETTEKIVQIKNHLLTARSRQKSYADLKRRLTEFEVGDKVMLKASPWRGVIRFGKAWEIKSTRCFVNNDVVIPLDEVQLDDKLHFVEEPVEIMDRELKRLKQSRILIVKVRWNSRRRPEFTWEREDFFRSKYPHLFARRRVTRQGKHRDVAS